MTPEPDRAADDADTADSASFDGARGFALHALFYHWSKSPGSHREECATGPALGVLTSILLSPAAYCFSHLGYSGIDVFPGFREWNVRAARSKI